MHRFSDWCMQGDVGRIKMLLQQGVNVNVADQYGKSALMWAAYEGHIETVAALRSHTCRG